MASPIDSKADSPTRMFHRKPSHKSAVRELDVGVERSPLHGRQHRKNRLGKQMVLNRAELVCFAMHRNSLERLSVHHVQEVSQTNDMIEMRMRKKNVQRRGRDEWPRTKQP